MLTNIAFWLLASGSWLSFLGPSASDPDSGSRFLASQLLALVLESPPGVFQLASSQQPAANRQPPTADRLASGFRLPSSWLLALGSWRSASGAHRQPL